MLMPLLLLIRLVPFYQCLLRSSPQAAVELVVNTIRSQPEKLAALKKKLSVERVLVPMISVDLPVPIILEWNAM